MSGRDLHGPPALRSPSSSRRTRSPPNRGRWDVRVQARSRKGVGTATRASATGEAAAAKSPRRHQSVQQHGPGLRLPPLLPGKSRVVADSLRQGSPSNQEPRARAPRIGRRASRGKAPLPTGRLRYRQVKRHRRLSTKLSGGGRGDRDLGALSGVSARSLQKVLGWRDQDR